MGTVHKLRGPQVTVSEAVEAFLAHYVADLAPKTRTVFDQTLRLECARLKRTGSAFSLLMLDIDHFKALNDSEGHQRGDEFLKLVGAELKRAVKRQTDFAARYGGEE